ncbi:MAG: hypothetical protein JXB49_37490 [Bacteroidales bacterium]|nr:hypothetical protein [Bacteroidales bacterium]
MIITTHSYPRAALIGNPSDGYFGKTIAFPFDNFKAEVVLYETPELEIIPADYDTHVFNSLEGLVRDVKLYGYYGGIRLIKAAIMRFYEYCHLHNHPLDKRNFTVRYHSTIPFRLGLAGSSAIITACMKALMNFYNIEIPKPMLANLVLSVEVEELKITAGLQDRVVQAYECPVYMNFAKEYMDKQGYGEYTPLSRELFPSLYIAYRLELSEGSEVVHNNFKARYDFGDEKVLKAIEDWKDLTEKVKDALENKKTNVLSSLINSNFDIRQAVMNISKDNLKMVEIARKAGASAKFTGSGGAIIGTYENEKMFNTLCEIMKNENIEVIKPNIIG